MLAVELNVPVEGSYSSLLVLSAPPVIKTVPSLSRVAVCKYPNGGHAGGFIKGSGGRIEQ